MYDPLQVQAHAVSVTPVTGMLLNLLQARLAVMEKEVEHLRRAVAGMRTSVATGNARHLTDSVMDSRNWALSVAMSHCVVQAVLGRGTGGKAAKRHGSNLGQLEQMFAKAGKTGVLQGAELLVGFTTIDAAQTI